MYTFFTMIGGILTPPTKSGNGKLSSEEKDLLLEELGTTGIKVYAGIISEEYLKELTTLSQRTDVFDRMRKSDGTIKATLLAMTLPILSTRFYIKPASDSLQDKQIAEFVDYSLFKGMSISWADFLRQSLTQFPFGFSVWEKCWKNNDSKYPGKFLWSKFAFRYQKSIWKWLFDESGGPAGIVQWALFVSGDNSSYKYQPIPIDKLLIFSYEREGSNLEGTSVLRACYKHWVYLDKLYLIQGIGLERNSVGVPVIKVQEGGALTKGVKEYAEKLLEAHRIHGKMGMILPWPLEFDSVEGKMNNAALQQAINHHKTVISQATLTQFMQLGMEGKGGSRALGEADVGFFLLAEDSAADSICNTLNSYAIKQLVDYNFPGVQDYPMLEHEKVGGSIDIKELSKILSELTTGKYIPPTDALEADLRRRLGLPEREEGEKSLVSEIPSVEGVIEGLLRLREELSRA